MHHYNFPAYSVGETGPNRGPGRREIGHGALAEKALVPVLPPKETFPYTIRVVSEVMSSNGSSSMASTCGSTLALMDAGVPLTAPVAGMAMGLASNKEGKYVILTDLQDLEDGPGGMDFKIAGTRAGITAIQMDTKTDGLTADIVRETFAQARAARMQILDVMEKCLPAPRADISPWAPKIVTFMIPVDKIREVIGPGGKVINEIIDKCGVKIDIEQTGQVSVTAPAGAELEKAVDWIKNIVRVVAAGEIFEGVPVTRVEDYGIFVEVLPKQDGMVHVSEMSWQRVESPHDLFKIGDHVKVVVKEIDDQGRISLSMKRLTPPPADFQERAPRERDDRAGGGDRGGRPQGRGGFNGGGGRGGDRGGRRF
jgi:polyribonucleotide nucleotidyltransferase